MDRQGTLRYTKGVLNGFLGGAGGRSQCLEVYGAAAAAARTASLGEATGATADRTAPLWPGGSRTAGPSAGSARGGTRGRGADGRAGRRRLARCQQFGALFFVGYRCDHCHRPVYGLRPRLLYVYCSKNCRKTFRHGRRRLLRRHRRLLRHWRGSARPTRRRPAERKVSFSTEEVTALTHFLARLSLAPAHDDERTEPPLSAPDGPARPGTA